MLQFTAESNRAVVNEGESNVQALDPKPSNSSSIPQSFVDEMKKMFLKMMNQWFNEFKQANLATLPPLPLIVPPTTPLGPQNPLPTTIISPSVDKIQKCGGEEFRGKVYDDLANAKYWLMNTKSVFAELMCTPKDCLRCVVSLLKDEAYSW